ETERYGGRRALALAEQIFCADSEAVLAILEDSEGDAATTRRWHLLLFGLHRLLDDLHLDLEQRLRLLTSLRESFGREHRVNVAFERQLGEKYRAERAEIERCLDGQLDAGAERGLAALARRSHRIAPIVDEILVLDRAKSLTVGMDELAASLLHM